LIEIDIIVNDDVTGLLPVEEDRVHDHAVYVLQSGNFDTAVVNIVFIGDEKMTELNETYKNGSGTTDVLSFDLSDTQSGKIDGEVYVSLERARSQSVEYNINFEEEVIRLVTHGLLHLTGRIHDTGELLDAMKADTERMVNAFFDRGGSQ